MDSPAPALRFGAFEADLQSGELRRQGVKIKLQPKTFEILRLLLERPGQVVTRAELQQRLWPADTFVEFDNNMNHAISRLREALGDSADDPRFIETLPRRGYRFVAAVDPACPPAAEAPEASSPPHPEPRRPRNLWPLGVGLLLAVSLAVLAYHGLHRDERPIDSLAVLPLVSMNVAEGSDDEYLAFGMTEAITAELSRIRALKVISQTSAMQYKGTAKSLPQIARELGVDAVVEGSVVREGNEIRITVQLIEAATDTHLWAETYQRELRNVLTMQTEIARAIAGEIHVTLTPGEQATLNAARTVDPAAHEAYLRGRYFWQRQTEEGIRKALPYFERATAIDPSYAPAYAGLSDVYWELASGIEPTAERRRQAQDDARAAARRALELDENLADAHVAHGFVLLHYDWDWAAAERAFRRAIALSPNEAVAYGGLGEYFWAMNQPGEALNLMRRQFELNPTALLSNRGWGSALFYAGRYGEAVEVYRKALEMEPDEISTVSLSFALTYAERHEDAVSLLRGFAEATDSSRVLALLAHAQARAGNGAEARRILREVEKGAQTQPLILAIAYAALGDLEKTLAWLERGYEERESGLFLISIMPQFAPLRSDPRFQDLLRRMNLPQ